MIYERGQRYYPLLLILMVMAALVITVALSLPNGWLLAVALFGAATLPLAWRAQNRRTVGRAYAYHTSQAANVREQRHVLSDNGIEQRALIIPLADEQEWQLALTHNGYVLVDEVGQVRHTLKHP